VSADRLREQLRAGGIEVYDKDRRWVCARDGRRGYFDDLPEPAVAAHNVAAVPAAHDAANAANATNAAAAPDYANAAANAAPSAAVSYAATDASVAAHAADAAAPSDLPPSPLPMPFPPPIPSGLHEHAEHLPQAPSSAAQGSAWGQSHSPEYKSPIYYQDLPYYYDRQPRQDEGYSLAQAGEARGNYGNAVSQQAPPAFMQHGMPHWPNAGLGTGFM